MKRSNDGENGFEEAEDHSDEMQYILRLYVAATTPHSTRAISNIRKICEEYLSGRFRLEVVDISKDPSRAKAQQIVAAPTLIKELPLPIRRFIGDMSNTERILLGLDLEKIPG